MTAVCKISNGNTDLIEYVRDYSSIAVFAITLPFSLLIRVSQLKFYARLLFAISVAIFLLALLSLIDPVTSDE